MRISNAIVASQILGWTSVLAKPVQLAERATALTNPTVGSYSYVGCASEPFQNGTRALQGCHTSTSSMTVEYCAAFCSAYNYFSVEYGQECYCGNTLTSGTTIQADNSQCTYKCAANCAEGCGGFWYMGLYSKLSGSTGSSSSSAAISTSSAQVSTASSTTIAITSTAATTSATFTGTPTAVASVAGYSYVACAEEPFANGASGRALTALSTSASNMTVEYCASFCSGYTFFGVEYASECYCGNTIQSGTTSDVAANCNIACAGNAMELCGGSGRANLYQLAGSSSVTLPTTYSVVATSTASTSSTTAAPLTTTAASSTSTAASSTTTAVSSTASVASSTTTTAAATVVPSSPATVGSYAYDGCVAEPFFNGVNGVRALTGPSTSANNMTVEYCASFCSGYTYFGVEYSSQCYCGNSISNGTSIDATNYNCLDVCSGNAGEYCGGASHLNLYQLGSAGTLNLPSTYTVSATSTSTSTSVSVSVSIPTVIATTATTTSSSSAVTTAVTTAATTAPKTSSVISTSSSTTGSSSSTSSVASSTSSSSSSSTSSSSSSSTSTPCGTKTTSASTTMITAASTTLVTATSSTSSAAATSTFAANYFSLSSCPSFSVSKSSGLLGLFTTTYTYSSYYTGTGKTENCANPGNASPALYPAKTFTISGSSTACQAAQSCLTQMASSCSSYLSYDLHYRTDSKAWECVAYSGNNVNAAYFNVANSAVTYAYGFNGVTSTSFGW